MLLIVGASFLLILTALLPETARSVVGNGEIEAPGWNRPLLPRAKFRSEKSTRQSSNSLIHSSKVLKTRDLWRNANPFKSLRLLLYRDNGLVVWSSAIVYAAYYVIQASMPQILENKYGFNEQQVGLSYLAIGGGVVIGGYANGTVFLSMLRHGIASYVRSSPTSRTSFSIPGPRIIGNLAAEASKQPTVLFILHALGKGQMLIGL